MKLLKLPSPVSFYFLNVVIKKIKITNLAHICSSFVFLLDSAGTEGLNSEWTKNQCFHFPYFPDKEKHPREGSALLKGVKMVGKKWGVEPPSFDSLSPVF